MLSLSKGRCIGKIVGGDFDGKYIRIYEEGKRYKCCNWCSDKCAKQIKKKCCIDCKAKAKGGCITLGGKIGDRVEINIKSGMVEPVPNCERDEDGSMLADTCFVAGPQGVGKSHIIGKYIGNDKIHYPKKDVIIFSNFTEDKPLDIYKPLRVKIDDKLISKPIKKEECRNSICVFDDIDTIQPKKLADACRALRDDFLQCGRKENIKVLATSHQLMNYAKTRDLLNSCNKIIIFPRGTSPYHTGRLLKEYVGLDKASIKYILKLPSRWILIDKTFPSYCLHEHGCVLLNELPGILNKKPEYKNDLPINGGRFDKYGYPQKLLLKMKKNNFSTKNGDVLQKDLKGFIRGKTYISLEDNYNDNSDNNSNSDLDY